MKLNPKVDAYIGKSAEFARPILEHIRKVVHETCPEVEENIKWGFPHFDYKGEIMCSMAAFKAHCVFTFWKGSLMRDPDHVMEKVGRTAMGQFGKIHHLKDLPDWKILEKYIREAMKFNDEGIKVPAKPKKEVVVPRYFSSELEKHPKALNIFQKFSPSHKREYVEWITEAKKEETRKSRLEKAMKMISEGKSRNYKYE